MGRKLETECAITTGRVKFCLKNLHNLLALRQSPLKDLPCITKTAGDNPGRGTNWGRAYALQSALMLCCKRIITGLEGRQDSVLMTEYLKLYTSGDPINVARFAREAGTNRMMVYRKIAPLALAMVTEELECYNREHSGTG